MRQKIIHFMMGRYGMDTLNNYLIPMSYLEIWMEYMELKLVLQMVLIDA